MSVKPTYKICPCRHNINSAKVCWHPAYETCSCRQYAKLPNVGRDIYVYGHAHAFNAFPAQTVYLVVDSGELGQPDDAF